MTLVSLVIPVYHNAPSLPDLVAAFQTLAARNPQDEFEFIFVDDGSGDDSHAVLLNLQKTEPRMRVLKLSRNFGSNPAIMAGLSQARGEAVAAIAADLQDPPELIHDMLDKWRQGHKVILAARAGRDDPGITSILADVFYSLFRRFAIKTMPPRGFDFFLIDRQVVDHINAIQEGNPYLMGLILWLGFDPQVIYYDRRARPAQYGVSMWTLAKKIKYFIDSFVAFSYLPVRAASILGFLLSGMGGIYAMIVILARLLFAVPVEGWTSLMVVLLIIGGAQMIMIGILGEYLWRNLDETRKRPRFIISTVTDAPEKEMANGPTHSLTTDA
jgi:polyisoprenyl-phosphate glycosyltransferase